MATHEWYKAHLRKVYGTSVGFHGPPMLDMLNIERGIWHIRMGLCHIKGGGFTSGEIMICQRGVNGTL